MPVETNGCGSNQTIGLSWGLTRSATTVYWLNNNNINTITFSNNSNLIKYNSTATNLKGFNGKEADNEINVDGGSYDFGARIYDGRLGRWLSLDPLMAKFPDMSPYNFANNNPIYFIDPDGKSGLPNHVQRAVDGQNEYEKKGYSTVLMITNQGKVKLFVYETKTTQEWVELADGTFEIQEVNRLVYKEPVTYNRDLVDAAIDLAKGIDDWTQSLKGNNDFRNKGIILTSNKGGQKNADAPKLSKTGKAIIIPIELIDGLGKLDNKAQSRWFKKTTEKAVVTTREGPENDLDMGKIAPSTGDYKAPEDKDTVIRVNKPMYNWPTNSTNTRDTNMKAKDVKKFRADNPQRTPGK